MTQVVNGVNLEALGGFVDAVKNGAGSPEIRFTARSNWTGGTRTEVTIDQFTAGGVNAAPPERSFKPWNIWLQAFAAASPPASSPTPPCSARTSRAWR